MLLCNFHRSVFTALLPLLADGLGLLPAEVGLLQSAMLWGYVAGQIPAGKLADDKGGDRVLLGGLGLWSLATAATATGALAVGTASPGTALAAVLAARVAMGFFSSVIMPCNAAVTAQWVPPERKAGTLAMIYAFFNLGGVLGLIAAPHMAARSGWPTAFVTAAAGGVMWSLLGSAVIARAGPRPPRPAARTKAPQLPQPSLPARTESPGASGASSAHVRHSEESSSAPQAAATKPPTDASARQDPAGAGQPATAAADGDVSALKVVRTGRASGSSAPPTPPAPPASSSASAGSSPSLTPIPSLTIPSLPSTSSFSATSSTSSPSPQSFMSSASSWSSPSYPSSSLPYTSYPGSQVSPEGIARGGGESPQGDVDGGADPRVTGARAEPGPGSTVAAAVANPWEGPGPLSDRAESHQAASVSGREPAAASTATAKRSAEERPTGAAAAEAAATATADPGDKGPGEVVRSTADRRRTFVQVAALCWCHGVIGWGFFVMQSWLPLYLQSLGVASLADAGLLASLPWLAAAFTATIAAGFADRLVRRPGTKRLTVRRGMHTVATLGCAAALLPLATTPGGAAAVPPLAATACLVGAVGCYGFSFGGFHAYVQDVAAADAGKVLGLTNFTATLGGIAGNLATGWLLQASGGYGGVFLAAAALYCSSWLVFTTLLNGEPISMAAAWG